MKTILVLLLCLGLTGCAITRVNYGSLVNKYFPSKNNNAEIILSTQDLDRPYEEIGVISVVGANKNTSYDELNKNMIQKAREVGADAVIKIEYGTQANNVMIPSSYGYGSIGATIHKPSCKGIVVVFKEK
jgi:hypothetical protein